MSRAGDSKGMWAVALATASLLLPATVVIAAPQQQQAKRPPAVALSFDGGFTPAQADPRLAAALAGRPALASDFRFTPAASKRRPSQIRIAIRARATTPGQVVALRAREVAAAPTASSLALTPATYNLGAAVGWKQFAISADVARARGAAAPALTDRDGASVGVSYNGKRFTGRVAASTDRPAAARTSPIADPTSYALDVGGAYNISRSIAVTGGVKYKIERERVATFRDQRRDSQAVYVGTAFKF
ncbi:porin [Sphingomonas swuensis]|uniref:porin n=1 Tax=Sphingomonas swuensis TaxID=977800 RepID=UPI0031D58BB2